VEGHSLAALIRENGKLETSRAVEFAVALAQAVAYAHERDVLHRDIKPANVMITKNDVPRLMDFGIASSATAGDAGPRLLVGTPFYMAPEYICDGIYEPSSDVFALGVVLYEMLTRSGPFAEAIRARRYSASSRRIWCRRLGSTTRLTSTSMPCCRNPWPSARPSASPELLKWPPPWPPTWLQPYAGQAHAGHGTLDYLVRRIRHKGIFRRCRPRSAR